MEPGEGEGWKVSIGDGAATVDGTGLAPGAVPMTEGLARDHGFLARASK